jgi:predicted dehydrogenase
MPTTLASPATGASAPAIHPVRGSIGLAFLGCGAITSLHSRTLRHPGVPVRRYYASRDGVRAEAWNRRHGGAGSFSSYRAAITDRRVDVVLIATPPVMHLDWTLEALAHAKHVIVEKPAFLRSGDVTRVEAAADRTGCRVLVAENYAYKPIAHALRQAIASGELGEILVVRVDATKHQRTADWRADERFAGGGALFEGGVHWVDLMANLGLRVESVQGFRPGLPRGPERTMVVVFQYEQGAVGTLFHSWETPALLRGLRLSKISGTRGSVTFESNALFALVRGRRSRLIVPGMADLRGYGAMFRDFLAAIRTGAPPQMTLDRARLDLQLIEAAYGSLPDAAVEDE